MQRAADGIAREAAHVERLLHHPFADKCRVAMDQDEQIPVPFGIAAAILPDPHATGGHGIDKFQMAGVGAQRQVYGLPGRGQMVMLIAQMIFHVAAAPLQFGIGIREFPEDGARTFAQDVGEHVQTPAMGHPQNNAGHALLTGVFDGEIQQRNQALAAFQGKALRPDEFCPDKLLEHHRVRQSRENAKLSLPAEGQPVLRALHAFLQPIAHPIIVNVHELNADGAAVGAAQPLDDLAQGQLTLRLHRRAGKGTVQVGLGESVTRQVELRWGDFGLTQRVHMRDDVPAHSIAAHQRVHAFLQNRHPLFLVLCHAVAPGRRRVENAVGTGRHGRNGDLASRLAVGQRGKIAPPFRRSRRGIAQIIRIHALHIGQIRGTEHCRFISHSFWSILF